MWIARQDWTITELAERTSGRIGKTATIDKVALYLMHCAWSNAIDMLAKACRNRAAIYLLDGMPTDAELWIARSRAFQEMRNK